jgi:hypothetical protein
VPGISDRATSRTFNEVYLDTLRTAYLTSKNSLYIWAAIHWCLNESPEQPLPDWCKPYLAETAWRINALGSTGDTVGQTGKGTGGAPETPTTSDMLHALGFTSKGRNAFKSAAAEMRAFRAAVRFRELRNNGTPYGKALEEVMEWLGVDDQSNAKRLIKAGRRLMRG